MVVVDLAAAAICFMGACYPALIGKDTPSGTFSLSHWATDEPGYGGDIMVFKESRRHVWAIHRVLTHRPDENRVERLRASDAARRRGITQGCVNVMPDVYRKLVECCSKDVVFIQ